MNKIFFSLTTIFLFCATSTFAQIPMPERGFVSTTPAATWEGGLISGNGTLGASVFSRYRIVPQFYAHAEFSAMKYDLSYYRVGSTRDWVPFLFLGGGFSQPVSRNVWLNAQILFDVLQNENSPYPAWEPFYSIGFGVGF